MFKTVLVGAAAEREKLGSWEFLKNSEGASSYKNSGGCLDPEVTAVCLAALHFVQRSVIRPNPAADTAPPSLKTGDIAE